MRRTLSILALGVLATLTWSDDSLATEYWFCDVGTPSIVDGTENDYLPNLRSAGIIELTTDGTLTDGYKVVNATHSLRKSGGLLVHQTERSSHGLVHTNVESLVMRGNSYYARLIGSADLAFIDPRPESDACNSSSLDVPQTSGDGEGGGGGESDGDPNADDPAGPSSPILIDLDRGGFTLTDLEGGVTFDLNGDGVLDQVAWTSPGTGDVWLALDRNFNGRIDDGVELFGNFTPQPAGGPRHGYRALAVFDEPSAGGDGDGRISSADQIFGSLLGWRDQNQDGVSQPLELKTLREAGIVGINLDYRMSRRTDQHGNEYRYHSSVRLERGRTRSVDVFLLVSWGE